MPYSRTQHMSTGTVLFAPFLGYDIAANALAVAFPALFISNGPVECLERMGRHESVPEAITMFGRETNHNNSSRFESGQQTASLLMMQIREIHTIIIIFVQAGAPTSSYPTANRESCETQAMDEVSQSSRISSILCISAINKGDAKAFRFQNLRDCKER